MVEVKQVISAERFEELSAKKKNRVPDVRRSRGFYIFELVLVSLFWIISSFLIVSLSKGELFSYLFMGVLSALSMLLIGLSTWSYRKGKRIYKKDWEQYHLNAKVEYLLYVMIDSLNNSIGMFSRLATFSQEMQQVFDKRKDEMKSRVDFLENVKNIVACGNRNKALELLQEYEKVWPIS